MPSSPIICKAPLTSSRFASIGVIPLLADGCSDDSSNKRCKRAPSRTAHGWQNQHQNRFRHARYQYIASIQQRLPLPRRLARGETTTGSGYRTQMDTPLDLKWYNNALKSFALLTRTPGVALDS